MAAVVGLGSEPLVPRFDVNLTANGGVVSYVDLLSTREAALSKGGLDARLEARLAGQSLAAEKPSKKRPHDGSSSGSSASGSSSASSASSDSHDSGSRSVASSPGAGAAPVDEGAVADDQPKPAKRQRKAEPLKVPSGRRDTMAHVIAKYETPELLGQPGADDTRGKYRDTYESDDSFIDDTELVAQIQEIQQQTRTTTHTGFYAIAGDADLGAGSDVEIEAPAKKAKPKGPSKTKQERLDDFIAEHGKAPLELNQAATQALEAFHDAVGMREEALTPKSVFPYELDPLLADVDVAVRASHKNGYRTNAYFARLMRLLPYSKNTLQRHVVRVVTGRAITDANRKFEAAKEALQAAIAARLQQVPPPTDAPAAAPAPASVPAPTTAVPAAEPPKPKPWFSWDRTCRVATYDVVMAKSAVLDAEVAYQSKLSAADRKHLPDSVSREIKTRVEVTAFYDGGLLGMWPAGSVDVKVLRGVVKAERARVLRLQKKAAEKEQEEAAKADAVGAGAGSAPPTAAAPVVSAPPVAPTTAQAAAPAPPRAGLPPAAPTPVAPAAAPAPPVRVAPTPVARIAPTPLPPHPPAQP